MSNSEKMGLRKMPFAFTEQGVTMLSAVLRTKTAIKVSLAIMDAFVQLRHLMMGNGGLVNRLSNPPEIQCAVCRQPHNNSSKHKYT